MFFSKKTINTVSPTLLCLAISCGQSGTNHKQPLLHKTLNFTFDTSKIAIISLDSANNWAADGESGGYLTKEDIPIIEKLLRKSVNDYNKSVDSHMFVGEINLDTYKRQYVPYIDKNGQRKVWVNCFCSKEYYWKTSIVGVDDGGACYFQVTINLDNKSYTDFMTNGIA